MGATRAFHDGKDELLAEKAGGSGEAPAIKIISIIGR
jgi:hypothetical protein